MDGVSRDISSLGTQASKGAKLFALMTWVHGEMRTPCLGGAWYRIIN